MAQTPARHLDSLIWQFQVAFDQVLIVDRDERPARVRLELTGVYGPYPRALRLKYGADYARHRLERIPHCHTDDKTSLALIDEMDCTRFIAWVQDNLAT
jgi:hypothetical protein